ncbi:hypothetical protein [Bradyrhizobium sp. WSM2254]|uniref:hypothetical protein n=1 Tax=Bradyrhizobium sp. WSM2254 TaxID=1188263 RepID=UPI000487FAA1|nr:hypothetical protein [Bradyrhizobium sp. WSM2254]
MELPDTAKLLSLSADKQDEGLPTLNPAFCCEDISGPPRPTSSACAYTCANILAEFSYVQLRYTFIVGQRAQENRLTLATLARRIGTNITPARRAFSQLVPTNAANANRRLVTVVRVPKPAELGELLKWRLALYLPFAIATPLHPMSDCSGFKVSAFRVAMLEPGQPSPGMDVGRIWSRAKPIIAITAAAKNKLHCMMWFLEETIVTCGSRDLKQACDGIFHELAARITPAFSTLSDEYSIPPYLRRLLGSPPEKRRPTVKPETAMRSGRNRTRDSFKWDVRQLGKSLRQRQQYVLLRGARLCFSGAVALLDTTVATA